MCEDVAKAGDSVLLDINDGERFLFARLNASATVKLGNGKFSLECIVGCPFGAIFEVQRGALARCSSENVEDPGEDEGEENGATRDNRNLIDNNTAQTLSAEDIAEMKRDGTSGRDIVNALIANSASYDSKTAFSQEKYKRKKQRKYAPRIKVRRPTARSVCEALFAKSPFKIGCLRIDSLSMLLSQANVGAESNVLVVDMVGGLVTAAVAERLSGFGSLCSVYYTSKPPSSEIVNLLNLDSETCSKVFRVSFAKLLELHSASKEKQLEAEVLADAQPADMDCENVPATEPEPEEPVLKKAKSDAKTEDMECDAPEMKPDAAEQKPETESDMPRRKPKSGVIRGVQEPSDADISAWLKTGFSSLVVAAPDMNPLKIVQSVAPFLAPSASFSVYHTYLQPLAECMSYLQGERIAVGLQLCEPWMREYQVLPSRTHPHMQMSATGGYLLSGIRLAEQDL